MSYEIFIFPKAQKDFKKINSPFKEKIAEKIHTLEKSPHPAGSLKLTNEELYRIRIGDYRVVYEVDEANKKILISRIKHRKEAYK